MILRINLLLVLTFFFLSINVFAQYGLDGIQDIEKNIKPVSFKNKSYSITDFGAVSSNDIDSRNAINSAIKKCSAEGGGRVIIPAGNFFVKGSIVLKSGVNLHLEEGVKLVFSSDEKDYLPLVFTRWEGTELYNYSPLVYARDETNIAITGKGLLNGMGTANFANWKPKQKKAQQKLREMGRAGTPVKARVFGEGHYLRPAFVEFIGCNNVLIEDITLVNSPFWVIHPIYCNNVTVRGVTVNSKNLNSDGCDPESSTNVLIENCRFITGDDGIAIKAGRDNDAWRVGKPTENVLIRNCTFETETNAVCIGSEMSGGVRNIFVDQIKVSKAGNAIYFKSNLDRGGFIEKVWVRNINVDSVKSSLIKFDPDYKSESKYSYPTRFRDFKLENMTCNYAGEYGLDIRGFEKTPVLNVRLDNVNVQKTPEATRILHAEGISFQNVKINGKEVISKLSNKTISLNGSWDVTISDQKPVRYMAKVPVPGIITMAKPSLGKDLDGINADSIAYKYVWYRHKFQLSETGYPQALLKIRAKYNVMVWLNGVEIGYDHHSTYSHAEFDITKSLNLNGANELVVRIGSWNTSSAPSKENSAEWWRNTRAPGIWDDVSIELGQVIADRYVKILPDTKKEITSANVDIENNSDIVRQLVVTATIYDGESLMSKLEQEIAVPSGQTKSCKLDVPSKMLSYWSAGKEGNPKLYRMNIILKDRSGKVWSERNTMFGYRSIEVNGKDVLLNGEKVFFRAENIAFVRALNRWSDRMFDEDWIRNFLRTAIQEYNFNYLRIHLGHAYNKWYEIADQEGIMLQDEWRYMHDDEPVGKDKAEAYAEIKRWIKQNVNHPSIVTWDQENEGNVRLEELKAELRKFDPTRLWGEDSFEAKHIYQYSENIVKTPEYQLSDKKPTTILESCRLWTNEFGLLEPRENFKTSRTSSGWSIFYYTKPLMAQLLADLHGDLGTYFRSSRIQAWAPFALLSGMINGHNFYDGNILDSLTAQPNLMVLKRLNEPVGTSIDMLQAREWYKDKVVYKPGTIYTKMVNSWNDFAGDRAGRLTLVVKGADGAIISNTEVEINVPKYQSVKKEMSFLTPQKNGVYWIEPSLNLKDGAVIQGVSRRIMVADKVNEDIEGLSGFGGIRNPIEGGYSIIHHFLPVDLPENIEKAIISAVGNGLLDKLSMDKTSGNYIVQSTTYHSATNAIITKTLINQKGKVLSKEDSEALNYVDLSQPVKKAMIGILGTVPVDESRIIKTIKGDDVFYEISVIGSPLRYRINITSDGTIKSKEIIKKSKK